MFPKSITDSKNNLEIIVFQPSSSWSFLANTGRCLFLRERQMQVLFFLVTPPIPAHSIKFRLDLHGRKPIPYTIRFWLLPGQHFHKSDLRLNRLLTFFPRVASAWTQRKSPRSSFMSGKRLFKWMNHSFPVAIPLGRRGYLHFPLKPI